MPAIVAVLARLAIQFGVTLGLTELATKYVFPYLDEAIKTVATTFGVSDEVATDIVANEWLRFAEQVGVGALVMRSRLPVKITD
ncbi:MAG: hypothetical protein AAB649_01640, partial [Patescibacteria group bacterium]